MGTKNSEPMEREVKEGSFVDTLFTSSGASEPEAEPEVEM